MGSTVLMPNQGGTGTSTKPTTGQMLIGTASGTYNYISSSTLGGLSVESDPIWKAASTSYLLTSTAALTYLPLSASTSLAYVKTELDPIWSAVSTSLTTANFGTSTVSQWVNNAGYITTTLSDETWTLHNSFPSACSAGQYVSALGDALTCSSIRLLTDVSGRLPLANFATGTAGYVLQANGASSAGWVATNTLGFSSGGTPGGSDGQVQFNDSSAFGATTSFFWDKTNGRLALNTSTPEFKLTLASDGGIISHADGSVGAYVATGGATPLSGVTLSSSGPGDRMIWYPRKAAFRAGGTYDGTAFGLPAVSDQWDEANLGYYSVAAGMNTKASGLASVSFGLGNTASGPASNAFGLGNTASGPASNAFGFSNLASGASGGATVFGAYSTASGAFAATAIGYYSVAAGTQGATSIGAYVTSSGESAIAMGSNLTVSGLKSFGVNVSSTAVTIPLNNTISLMGGNVGINTTSPLSILTVRGRNGTDVIFDVYTDAGDSAFTVLPAGAVGFGTHSPGSLVEFASSTGQADFMVTGGGATPSRFRFVATGGATYLQSGTSTASGSYADFNIGNMFNGTTWATFKGSNGYLGIATTTPAYTLQVNGTFGANLASGNGNFVCFNSSTKQLVYSTSACSLLGGAQFGSTNDIGSQIESYFKGLTLWQKIKLFFR